MSDIAASQAGTPVKRPRIGILDTARTIALFAMASYHFSWDLEHFGYLDPGTAETGLLRLYARVIASTFLFLAGASLFLAHHPEIRWHAFWRRLAGIAAAAIAISVVTYFMMPGEWIYFGILHSIVVASLIGIVFLKLPAFVTWIAVIALAAAIYVDNFTTIVIPRTDLFDPRYLAWTGFAQMPARSDDFVPSFPWLTPFLLGLACMRFGDARGWLIRLARIPSGGRIFAFLGRHSLAFYLIHQPLLFGLVALVSLVAPAPAPDPAVGYLRQCRMSCEQSGSKALCQSFCQCTLDRMKAQQLFTPFDKGEIKSDDSRIVLLAQDCTEAAEQVNPQ